jgi:hypothetical protein
MTGRANQWAKVTDYEMSSRQFVMQAVQAGLHILPGIGVAVNTENKSAMIILT